MSQEKIITRFPPSPTGYLHIGGARTALFNWLFSRQRGGEFILRIEDTDKERSSDQATNAILESMRWLGLSWDQGPYFQSERYGLYNTVIDKLLSAGQAYHCRCTAQEVEKKRKTARAKGLKPKYDGTCRDLGLGPESGSVVRLKIPQSGFTHFNDLIKGPIRFDNQELDDLIIRRSDGSPTYHLAVVADDVSLGVTYVIRGDDHVNNTPRQILIYEALKAPVPQYAHLPMILGPDRARLSKRHGAMSVLSYRDMGYLPQALLNALARLGWSHGDQEKFTMEELIEKFSLENVGKSAGVFNAEKLLDLNAWYIRESSDEDLLPQLMPLLHRLGFENPDEEKVKELIAVLKVRSKTLVEMAEGARFCLEEEVTYEEKADRKFLKSDIIELFQDLRGKISGLSRLTQPNLEKAFTDFMDEKQIKLRKIAQPLRVALTGRTVSPGIFEVMKVLGKDKVMERMGAAIAHIKAKAKD